MSWKYHINHWLWGFLDLLFPPTCGGCNRQGYRWCPDCQQQIRHPQEPVCQICGIPIGHQDICTNCKRDRPSYKIMRSWSVFEGPVRLALHQLKYRRNLALGEALADHAYPVIKSLAWPIEVIVPVPLGRKRLQERGYNQVGMVALPMAGLGGWEYTPQALSRARETISQVGLSIAERKENVIGAFRSDPSKIYGKKVLLMDDVATTGATISACAKALLDAGAQDVYAFTLSRALPHHGLKIV